LALFYYDYATFYLLDLSIKWNVTTPLPNKKTNILQGNLGLTKIIDEHVFK